MKGNKKIVNALNSLLADELSAILLYNCLGSCWRHDGLLRPAAEMDHEVLDETGHAQALAARIMQLEGVPMFAPSNTPPATPSGPRERLQAVVDAETDAVTEYTAAVELACKEGDPCTENLLRRHLDDEVGHLAAVERDVRLLEMLGVQNWLTEATRG